MLKVAVLFVLVAVAYAHNLKDVKAHAKYTKEKTADGFQINLNGEESEGHCTKYKWEVRVKGQYITLAEKKNGKYLVGPEMATYHFKLTVYDEDYDARKDSDTLLVVIGSKKNDGDKNDDDKKNNKKVKYVGKKKKTPPMAVADIEDVVGKDDGSFKIKVTAEDSMNCDDYIWEIKKAKTFKPFSEDMNAVYSVKKAGKFRFRLTCINNKEDRYDRAYTKAVIYPEPCSDNSPPRTTTQPPTTEKPTTKAPKTTEKPTTKPTTKLTTKAPKTTEDPCKGQTCSAFAEVKEVQELDNKTYKVHLTGRKSEGCTEYQWQRKTKKGYEDLTNTSNGGMTAIYSTPFSGKYTFRLKCLNGPCGLADSDEIETECISKM